MANIKNFESAIREESDVLALQDLEFRINGEGLGRDRKEPFIARQPTTEQVALLMASMGRDDNGVDGLSGMTNFLRDTLTPISWRELKSRLSDPSDPLEMADMQDIVAWIAEQSIDRPTQPRSESSGSRRLTGTASTRVSR